MRIWSIVALAMTLGVGLGYAGTVVEFGMVTPPPRIAAASPRAALVPRLAPPAVGEPMPSVVVDNAVFDFGSMGQGGTGTHTYRFTNEGEGDLQLKVGDPPCKCTVGELSKSIVPQGDTAEVTVEYHPGNMQGTFNRNVPIHTNDPLHPVIQLKITGKVVPVLSLIPSQVLAYNMAPGQSKAFGATLYAYHQSDLKVLGTRFSDKDSAKYFDVTHEPIPREDWNDPLAVAALRVELNILPGLPMGRFTQSLIIETNDLEQPEATLEILGNVTSVISVAGSGFDSARGVLTFGTIERDQRAERRLAVLVRDKSLEDIQLEVVEVVPPSLKVEFGEPRSMAGGALRRVPMTVVVPAGAEPASHFGTSSDEMGLIRLKTNHPDQPEIELHVRLIIEG